MRRTHFKLAPKGLVACKHCGEMIQPHMVCPHCGYYNGKKIVGKKEEKKVENKTENKKGEKKKESKK